MSFVVVDKPQAAVVAIQGKFLGSVERDEYEAAIARLKAAGTTRVVIDLSQADFLDSTAIGLLIWTLTTMKTAGGEVYLSAMNKRVKNLFVLTRLLGPVFTEFETADEALAALAESQPT